MTFENAVHFSHSCFNAMEWARPRRFVHALPEALFDILRTDVLSFVHERHCANTFWITLNDARGTSLGAALDWLARHIPPLRKYQGVELWVRIKSPAGEMPIHFDKDEALAAQAGHIRHPDFASVLYLTDDGGPTLIADQTAEGNEHQERRVRPRFLSSPRANAFLVFPGHLAHCVLAQRSYEPDVTVQPASRATLLLNWWTVKPLPPNCLNVDPTAFSTFCKELDFCRAPFEEGLIALDG